MGSVVQFNPAYLHITSTITCMTKLIMQIFRFNKTFRMIGHSLISNTVTLIKTWLR